MEVLGMLAAAIWWFIKAPVSYTHLGRGKAAGNQKDQAEGAGAVPSSGIHTRNGMHLWAIYMSYCD